MSRDNNGLDYLCLDGRAERLRLFAWLFGRDSLMAACHHDIHHVHPYIAARHLAALRNMLLH